MPSLHAVWPLVLLLLALILALRGQTCFQEGEECVPRGVLFYAAAIGVFTLGVLRSEPPAQQAIQPEPSTRRLDLVLREQIAGVRHILRREAWRAFALLLALVFTAVALNQLWHDPPLQDYTPAFLLWLGAIILYGVAVAPPRRSIHPSPKRRNDFSHLDHSATEVATTNISRDVRDRIRSVITSDRKRVLLIAIIMLSAALLRFVDLGGVPVTLGGDEGTFGLESIKTINGEINNPFSTGWFSVPTLSFYYNSLGIRLFGNNSFAVRAPWAVLGTLTVLLFFFLVQRLRGLGFSLMATTLLALYAYHIHFSRLGANNIADPFFVTLVLLLFYRALEERQTRDWVFTGVAIGVGQYFYFGGRFNAVITGALIVFLILREGTSFLRAHGRGILILIGAALITTAPLIQYAIRYPDDYNARINQIGIIQSGWLDREQEIRRQNAFEILLNQVQRAALAFNAYPDRTAWYGSPEPLFDTASATLFLLGLGYATLHIGDRRLFPMLAWWWGAMLLGGALTESPPSSQRLITLAPPAVFFVTLALEKIVQVLRKAFHTNAERLIPFAATAVLVLGLSSSLWYFNQFTPTRLYGSLNGMIATEMAHYMREQLGADWRVYFFGPPEIYVQFGSIPFLAPEVEAVDIIEPLTQPPALDLVSTDKNIAFIFLQGRLGELDQLRQTFPDGEFEEFRSEFGSTPHSILTFAVYKVPRSAASR